ncbi:MAG: hypothetical protein AAFN94_01350 [Pseudomonadota bacterium]
MSDDNRRNDTEDPLGPVHALVALATKDGLGEQLTWHTVLPVLLNIVQDPVGPRNCRRIFKQVNDPSALSTIEDWFNRAAAEREDSARDTERAAKMITRPVQRGAVGIAGGVGLALAVGTLTSGVGIPFLLAAGATVGGATWVGWKQQSSADRQDSLARDFRRLETIAREERESRSP